MEVMDYEKKLREYLNSSEVDQLYKSMILNLFPELAESEDEKIRKGLIKFFSDKDEEDYEGLPPRTKIIEWIEKQGEQKPAWKPSEEQMGVIEAVINNRSFQRRHLNSLYEQLKKLREE